MRDGKEHGGLRGGVMDGGAGIAPPRRLWGDGTGLVLCQHPEQAVQGPAGGWQRHKYLCAGGWARTTASPPWGRRSPSAGTSPCGGHGGVPGGEPGRGVPPAGIWGFWPYL